MTDNNDADLPRRVWQALTEVALRHDRKIAVSKALGLSWTRVLVLRRLTSAPQTQRQLAEHLTADPPYITVLVDDLETRGLVRRVPHPTDRRAKLVELTASGLAAAARADRLLYDPPAALRDLPADELATLARALAHLSR